MAPEPSPPVPDSARVAGLGLFPGPFYSVLSDTSPATSFCSPKRVNGILGESVVLPLDSGMMFKSITWSAPSPRQDAASGTTVPLAVVTPGGLGGLPRLVVEDERYRGRVRLYGRTYSLEISNLTMTDEGKYEAEKNLIGHNKYSCGYPLSIYSECLRVCMWGGQESLLVQHRLGDEDSPITCTATNPVSNSSASASPKVACEGDGRSIPLPRAHAAGNSPCGPVLGHSEHHQWARRLFKGLLPNFYTPLWHWAGRSGTGGAGGHRGSGPMGTAGCLHPSSLGSSELELLAPGADFGFQMV
uniref:SLAM family member 9-like n=1 Tax=Gopherus evgoodei TaxID=1825980 RepID=A0A8C4YFR9_9SAUR